MREGTAGRIGFYLLAGLEAAALLHDGLSAGLGGASGAELAGPALPVLLHEAAAYVLILWRWWGDTC